MGCTHKGSNSRSGHNIIFISTWFKDTKGDTWVVSFVGSWKHYKILGTGTAFLRAADIDLHTTWVKLSSFAVACVDVMESDDFMSK